MLLYNQSIASYSGYRPRATYGGGFDNSQSVA